jgi:hypothetical protein
LSGGAFSFSGAKVMRGDHRTPRRLTRGEQLLRAQRTYDTMIGRATGRLKPNAVHVYVFERPAFQRLGYER